MNRFLNLTARSSRFLKVFVSANAAVFSFTGVYEFI
jgi:hypothetical protein